MMRLVVGIMVCALSAAATSAPAAEHLRLPEPGLLGPGQGGPPQPFPARPYPPPPSGTDRPLPPDLARPDLARPDLAHPGTRADLSGGPGPPRGRVCFDPAETRENILAYRLTDPFRALRAGGLQGEALRAKLCRWRPDEFVYEVAVLLRDGRVIHVYMNAQSGQTVGILNPHRN